MSLTLRGHPPSRTYSRGDTGYISTVMIIGLSNSFIFFAEIVVFIVDHVGIIVLRVDLVVDASK